MSEHNPDDVPQQPPPPEPKRVLPYDTPARNGPELDWDDRPINRRVFGSFGGNMAVGLGALVASLVLGVTLGVKVRNAGPELTLGPAAIVLFLGVVAAFLPRYRGVLTGMLLILLIGLGIVLLVIGICAGLKK